MQTWLVCLTAIGSNQSGLTHTNGTVNLETYIGVSNAYIGTSSNHPLIF